MGVIAKLTSSSSPSRTWRWNEIECHASLDTHSNPIMAAARNFANNPIWRPKMRYAKVDAAAHMAELLSELKMLQLLS